MKTELKLKWETKFEYLIANPSDKETLDVMITDKSENSYTLYDYSVDITADDYSHEVHFRSMNGQFNDPLKAQLAAEAKYFELKERGLV